ncbi:3-hydroxyacyl-CoA dehydrogenase NAD-binding domain-containing protein [Nocardia pseudovaccinii]|uniref:3-hydroxyacyl-CoA dehydrogenase NAD-binding domain-containing protein n=1 Tax=Nocardia pseudovaccinii TaxID=189540 RepID=UPI0007A48E42|nr:3-hydroxyacyl-CoA dehydrogenase NAD-binding domain-containing protein [Nocardia pseudovaccinii]
MSTLEMLTVLGSGVLGGQISWHSAFKGKTVTVYDIDVEALDRCRAAHEQYAAIYLAEVGATDADIATTHDRLTYTIDLADAVSIADLVIEAVPEIPDVKTAVYQKMAGLLPDHTLVASNSSTLLPSSFAQATGRPEKFCALHFGNGIWAMNFVLPSYGRTRHEYVVRYSRLTEMGPGQIVGLFFGQDTPTDGPSCVYNKTVAVNGSSDEPCIGNGCPGPPSL